MIKRKRSIRIYCDWCLKEIERPEDGIVRWKWFPSEGRLDRHSFAIVHRGECDKSMGDPLGVRSGYHHIEHIQEFFNRNISDEIEAIKHGWRRDDCEGLADVLSRVNPSKSREKLFKLFQEAQMSSEAILNRHITGIGGELSRLTNRIIDIKKTGVPPGTSNILFLALRNLLIDKFGPTSVILEKLSELENSLNDTSIGLTDEGKCDCIHQFIETIQSYAYSALAKKEFETLLGIQIKDDKSRYKHTSFLYWAEFLWKWVKENRLSSAIIASFIASIIVGLIFGI